MIHFYSDFDKPMSITMFYYLKGQFKEVPSGLVG